MGMLNGHTNKPFQVRVFTAANKLTESV